MTDCIEWQGARSSYGYGAVTIAGQTRGAHRVAFERAVGPIPDGMWVLHRCDNPPCVNPEHLFLGTNADNVADKVAKGRQARGDRSGSRLYPERRPRGEAHARSKLNREKAAEIRELATAGATQRQLAARFGVSQSQIWHVVRGTRWL